LLRREPRGRIWSGIVRYPPTGDSKSSCWIFAASVFNGMSINDSFSEVITLLIKEFNLSLYRMRMESRSKKWLSRQYREKLINSSISSWDSQIASFELVQNIHIGSQLEFQTQDLPVIKRSENFWIWIHFGYW
jgi:hypothetical protein